MLRWMGLRGLMGKDAPVRHEAKRRRLKTVIQELVYMDCRMLSSDRQLTLTSNWIAAVMIMEEH